MAYKPTSPHKRHRKYFGAFSNKNITRHLQTITRFCKDKNISPDDADDMDFFRALLFESCLGKVHISYYSLLHNRKRSKTHFVATAKNLARYCDFIVKISDLFLGDFFNYLMRYKDKSFIGSVFDKLSALNKIKFIHKVEAFPDVVRQIPKLKLYMTFS
jgi:hypothetical protein